MKNEWKVLILNNQTGRWVFFDKYPSWDEAKKEGEKYASSNNTDARIMIYGRIN